MIEDLTPPLSILYYEIFPLTCNLTGKERGRGIIPSRGQDTGKERRATVLGTAGGPVGSEIGG